MRLVLTCLSGRGGVLRKTSISPASFSNLSAIWCGFTAPRDRGAEPLTCLTPTRCPSVSPSYWWALERRRSSRGIPLGCLPIGRVEHPQDTEDRVWGWQVGPAPSGPAAGAPWVALNISAHGGGHLLVSGTTQGQDRQGLFPGDSKEGYGCTDTIYAVPRTSKGREQPLVHFIYWCRCNPQLQRWHLLKNSTVYSKGVK